MSGQSRGTVSFPELSCVLNLVNEGTACDVSVRLRNLACQGVSPPVTWVFHSKEMEAQVHFLLNCHGFTWVFPNSSVISLARVSCMPAWNIRAHQNSGGLRTWMTAGRSRSETLARIGDRYTQRVAVGVRRRGVHLWLRWVLVLADTGAGMWEGEFLFTWSHGVGCVGLSTLCCSCQTHPASLAASAQECCSPESPFSVGSRTPPPAGWTGYFPFVTPVS